SGLWPGKVVTEVVPASDFWEAEPEHQDYLERYPGGYTCHFVRPSWRLPIRTDTVAKKAGAAISKQCQAGVHKGYLDRVPSSNERDKDKSVLVALASGCRAAWNGGRCR